MNVSLIIDIVLALICLIIIFKNAIRGFIKAFMGLAKAIVAILIAYIFCAPLGRVFSENFFYTTARGWINNAFLSTAQENDTYALHTLFEGIPSWFSNYILSSGVNNPDDTKYFLEPINAPASVIEDLSDSLGGALSLLISKIIAFIILFIVAQLLLLLVNFLLKKIQKIPFFRVVNIVLGLALGVALSAVFAWVVTLVAGWIINFGANYYPNVFTQDIVKNSIILNYFTENNLYYICRDFVANR